jgi:PAS domain S-box-containing protein
MHMDVRRSLITAHTFPADDGVFRQRVGEILDEVATLDLAETVAAVAGRLVPIHPGVAVTVQSDLARIGGPVVYVYRDGSAVPRQREDGWIEDAATARVVTDPSGTYLDANEAAAMLFGVPRDEIVGSSAGTFTRPDARLRDADNLWRALAATGRLQSRAIVCRRHQDDIAVEFLTIRDEDGPGRTVTYLRRAG